MLDINFNRRSKIFCPNISPSLKWPVVKNDILEPEWVCQNAIKIDQMIHQMTGNRFRLETVQDCLIKLGIKPQMHRLEKSIFSLNNDLVRLTRIMNNLVKDFKILSFKVIFQCLKLVKSFQKKSCDEYLIRRPTYINEIF